MVFGWIKRRRRRRLLSDPFPSTWEAILKANVVDYGLLSQVEQAKLRRDVQILVAEKNWEGCNGLVITDEIRVTIAGIVGLMLLGFHEEYFDAVMSILVYPLTYVAADRSVTDGGLVLEGQSARLGEAWYRGPVVLTWPDALAGGQGRSGGHNLVLHEFAHQFDMQNGRFVDGTPPLQTAQQVQRWQAVMQAEYEALVNHCQAGRRTLLDCYGTTNLAEMFAVTSELFFQKPLEMKEQHRELYQILVDFYRQDPARRKAN